MLEESKAKLLKQIEDDKSANLVMSRTQKNIWKNIKSTAFLVMITYRDVHFITTFLQKIECRILALTN